MAKKRRRRFRLLIYERMWQRWAGPCILIVLASVVLWWVAPYIPFLPSSFRIFGLIPLRILTLVPIPVFLIILAYAYLARSLAWVQCRSGHLRIQTPIYPLAISYIRIKGVRPQRMAQVFNPAEQKTSQRSWLQPYWGRTVVVVEITNYPLSKTWLRFWFSPYLFTPNATGFVFLVEDWMALSRQIDDSRASWEMRRAERRAELQAGR